MAAAEALWQAGKSSGEIAAALGVTRNMVIGVLARQGLIGDRLKPLPEKPAPHPLTALKANGCRWPEGEPGMADFRYCGLPVRSPGESWCATHRRRVYVRPGLRLAADCTPA